MATIVHTIDEYSNHRVKCYHPFYFVEAQIYKHGLFWVNYHRILFPLPFRRIYHPLFEDPDPHAIFLPRGSSRGTLRHISKLRSARTEWKKRWTSLQMKVSNFLKSVKGLLTFTCCQCCYPRGYCSIGYSTPHPETLCRYCNSPQITIWPWYIQAYDRLYSMWFCQAISRFRASNSGPTRAATDIWNKNKVGCY